MSQSFLPKLNTDERPANPRVGRRARALIVTALVLLLAWFLLPVPGEWIERVYSRSLYPALSSVIVPVTGAIPFSVAGVLLAAVPVLGIVAFIVSFRRWMPNFAWWMRWVWRVLGLMAILGWWFVLFWGANYRREPLTTQLGLVQVAASDTDLEALRARFERVVIADVPTSIPDQAQALESVSRAVATLTLEVTGVKPSLPSTVKRTPPGWLIAGGSATGVVSPWTLEAHVDGALPAVGIVANGAHELAHTAGFALEADVDVMSAIAGLRADDSFARYATALHWWSKIRPADATAWAQAKNRIPARAQRDLADLSAALRKHQAPAFLQGLQRTSYDAYLKTQRVPDGIANYGAAVAYLVSALQKGLL